MNIEMWLTFQHPLNSENVDVHVVGADGMEHSPVHYTVTSPTTVEVLMDSNIIGVIIEHPASRRRYGITNVQDRIRACREKMEPDISSQTFEEFTRPLRQQFSGYAAAGRALDNARMLGLGVVYRKEDGFFDVMDPSNFMITSTIDLPQSEGDTHGRIAVVQHWKGAYYEILHDGAAYAGDESHARAIVYRSFITKAIYVRPYSEFFEDVATAEGMRPRFRVLSASEAAKLRL